MNAYLNPENYPKDKFCAWDVGLKFGSPIDYLNFVAYLGGEHKHLFDEENLVTIPLVRCRFSLAPQIHFLGIQVLGLIKGLLGFHGYRKIRNDISTLRTGKNRADFVTTDLAQTVLAKSPNDQWRQLSDTKFSKREASERWHHHD